MPSPFGKFVRKMRIERGVYMGQMAEAIGVSPAFLSAVETGKKSIPKNGFVGKVADFFGLDASGREELSKAIKESEKVITIRVKPNPHMELLEALARKLPTLAEDADISQFKAEFDKL